MFIQRSVGGRVHRWNGRGDIAADGKELLSSLPTEPTGLIGYSYGGLVAWWVSLVAPHLVRELVILGSVPHKKHIPLRLRSMCRFVPSNMMLWWRDEGVLSRLYSVCTDIPQEPPKVSTTWGCIVPPRAQSSCLQSWGTYSPTRQRLKRYGAPKVHRASSLVSFARTS